VRKDPRLCIRPLKAEITGWLSDLGLGMQYARGEKRADLQGIDVFEFLAELALVKAQLQKV